MKSKKAAKTNAARKSGKNGRPLPKTTAKKTTTRARAPQSTTAKARTARPKPAKARPAAAKSVGAEERWNLRLYVAGQTPRSITAFSNLKRLCEERLAGRYKIEVIDLVKQPQLAQGDQIIAIPTLVRKLPEPIKRVVGDLSNIDRVLVGIDLQADQVN